MKILSMTATFGKLEHQTLTLEPGLNIIEAPNEWGKSTWCAFLVSMLYGLDTRAKSTRSTLADKERYAPWSGSPMEGAMVIDWNGRCITIQRRTKGRIPLGEFRAFETDTGLEIPELNAANCGQLLLGVERSVFLRSGFLRLTDLPVSQDEALRRRLNALVTTGDDSGEADRLAQTLKDLKNRCRYNRTGLLPQAQEELQALEQALAQRRTLQEQADKLRTRQKELEAHMAKLRNHKAALAYADAQSDAGRVAAAEIALRNARDQAESLEYTCRDIPSRSEAQKTVQAVRSLHERWLSLQMESRMLPQIPSKPNIPTPFRGVSPEKAIEQAQTDAENYHRLLRKKGKLLPLLWVLAVILLGIGAGLLAAQGPYWLPILALGAVMLGISLIAQIVTGRKNAAQRAQAEVIADGYGSHSCETWIRDAESYENQITAYRQELQAATEARGDLDQRLAALDQEATALTGGQELQAYLDQWQQVIAAWDACDDARRNCLRLENQLASLRAMARTAKDPEAPDDLTYSAEETNRLISDCAEQQRRLQLLQGQCQGKMDTLDDAQVLSGKIDALRARIRKLEQTCDALDLAQSALTQAQQELQRRFAPRITARAQALLRSLTGGRYDQIRFDEELTLSANAEGESTLRGVQWRSDGTADQMYFALRLAVAEVLTPNAPLILDDALLRFDDTRLRAALRLLEQEAAQKQVILFTCQSREKTLHTM